MVWVPYIVISSALCVATITDIRTLKVHNWLTLPLLLAGLGFHATVSGWGGIGESLFNVVVAFSGMLVLYVLGAVGAGDVKLVAALGAWLGTSTTFAIAAVGLFATGVYSLVMLVRQGRLADSWLHFKLSLVRVQMLARHLGTDGESVHEMASTPEGRARLVPFSVMIALGTAAAFIWHVYAFYG